MLTWATVDSPWLSAVTPQAWSSALDGVKRLAPSLVLSSHLPPARDMTDVLLRNLDASRSAPPFVGPDQQAMLQMMAAE